ncbi:cupin domain-containing protein [Lutimonas sp.]|uniref:cupin domain-containing protein n=1 Tax=Lutimonas sp. TaxID=1872403 RepID=UPI003D9BF110
MHIQPKQALEKLKEASQEFLEVFQHGSLNVEVYKPDRIDKQGPHKRDEIYVVISGSGTFMNGNDQREFTAGDFLFVKAGVTHRFINFTADFSTWVFFYGPEGGESNKL